MEEESPADEEGDPAVGDGHDGEVEVAQDELFLTLGYNLLKKVCTSSSKREARMPCSSSRLFQLASTKNTQVSTGA